jgi:hypothetical protein
MLDAVGLPVDGGEAELLCRLSQLVEELPWLAEMHGDLVPAAPGGSGKPALGGDLRVAFTAPA